MRILTNKEMLKRYTEDPSYRELFPREVDKYCSIVIFDSEETVIRQGEEALYLYYMLKGRCKISAYMENGKEVIIKKAVAPSLLGEIELFHKDLSLSVETLDPCTMLRFPLEDCKDILLNDRQFLLQNCIRLAIKERDTAFQLSRSISFPLQNRLADFILDNSYADIMNIPKTVIAQSLGVSYRHLEKVMNDLVEDSVLHKNGKKYRIINRKRLEELSEVLRII